MITREQMLKIMQKSGALDDLDINDQDFLDGHGRERLYVAVMELTYAGAVREAMDCLNEVSLGDISQRDWDEVSRRLGVEL
jgi:hypothetical protein